MFRNLSNRYGVRRTPDTFRLSRILLSSVSGVVALAAVGLTVPSTVLAQEEVLEEVLVTARKVQESVQDAPVAITAITSEQIEQLGIFSLADVAKVTAGLIFDDEFTRDANRPVIRGQANILGDSGVAYFIDGVYISAPINDYDLSQAERIEVVKGPQSALYGRNTYSGAINIVTHSPGEAFSGNVSVDVAEDDEYRVSASVSGPLGDVLSAGLAVRHYELGSPFTNQFDGSDIGEQESQSISGVLDFNPHDRFSLRARAYYGERDDGQPAVTVTDPANNNCFTDNGSYYGGTGRYFCGVVTAEDVSSDWSRQVPDAHLRDDNLQLSLKAAFDINDYITLTSITGYNERDYSQRFDADYTGTSFQTTLFTPNPFPFAGFPIPPFQYGYVGAVTDFTFSNEESVDEWSQEIQLSFQTDQLFGLLGFYYYDQDSQTNDNREVSDAQFGLARANYFATLARMTAMCEANPICGSVTPFFGPTFSVSRDQLGQGIENTAVFGMLSFNLTDNVRISAEARYQEEDISLRFIDQALGGDAAAPLVANASFDSFLPRVSIDWSPTDNNLLYVVYAEGTKPGGFNGSEAIEVGIPTFDEEDATSVEIGSKNTLAGGQLVANIAAFFTEVEGYQLTQNVLSPTGTPDSATVNAGDADIYGVEVELTAKPEAMPGFTMMLNYAWTDTEFTRGVDQNEGLLLDVADDGLTNCSTGKQFPSVEGCSTGDAVFGSIEGREIPRSAKHLLFADAELRRPMANGWEWFAGVNVSHESSKYAQVHNLAETGKTTLVGARVGVASKHYTLRIWGRNLTDEDSAPNVLRYVDASTFYRAFGVSPRRGPTVGATLSARF